MRNKQYVEEFEETSVEASAVNTPRAGTWIALVLGGVVTGAAIALLTAPRTGKATRKQLGGYLRSGQSAINQVPAMLRRSGR